MFLIFNYCIQNFKIKNPVINQRNILKNEIYKIKIHHYIPIINRKAGSSEVLLAVWQMSVNRNVLSISNIDEIMIFTVSAINFGRYGYI